MDTPHRSISTSTSTSTSTSASASAQPAPPTFSFVEIPAGQQSSRLRSLLGPETGISLESVDFALSPAFLPYTSLGGSAPAQRGVLRITGFAAETSRAEVLALVCMSGENEVVHFGIDRASGLTLDCFVEYDSIVAAKTALSSFSKRPMLGHRAVQVTESSQAAMMTSIFPQAAVVWRGATPVVNTQGTGQFPDIITGDELNNMMDLASGKVKPHTTNHVLKNHARVFENMISILKNFPWFATCHYTLHFRTTLYITTQIVFESLLRGVHGQYHPTLTMRLAGRYYLAAVNVPGFSEVQRQELMGKSKYLNIGVKPHTLMAFWPWQALVLKSGWEEDVIKFYGRLHSAACYTRIMQINRADMNFAYHHCFRAMTNPSESVQAAAENEIEIAKLMIKRTLAEATLTEAEGSMVEEYLHMIDSFRTITANEKEKSRATQMTGYHIVPKFYLDRRTGAMKAAAVNPSNESSVSGWRAPYGKLATIIESPTTPAHTKPAIPNNPALQRATSTAGLPNTSGGQRQKALSMAELPTQTTFQLPEIPRQSTYLEQSVNGNRCWESAQPPVQVILGPQPVRNGMANVVELNPVTEAILSQSEVTVSEVDSPASDKNKAWKQLEDVTDKQQQQRFSGESNTENTLHQVQQHSGFGKAQGTIPYAHYRSSIVSEAWPPIRHSSGASNQQADFKVDNILPHLNSMHIGTGFSDATPSQGKKQSTADYGEATTVWGTSAATPNLEPSSWKAAAALHGNAQESSTTRYSQATMLTSRVSKAASIVAPREASPSKLAARRQECNSTKPQKKLNRVTEEPRKANDYQLSATSEPLSSDRSKSPLKNSGNENDHGGVLLKGGGCQGSNDSLVTATSKPRRD